MQSDVYRFVALRQPVKAPVADDVVIETSSDSSPTELVRRLEEARRSDEPRPALSAAAGDYIASPQFVKSLAGAAPELVDLQRLIVTARGAVDPNRVRSQLSSLGVSATDLERFRRQLSDSLLASLVSTSIGPAERAELESGLRVISILERILRAPQTSTQSLKQLYARPVALPRTVFPLPSHNEEADAEAVQGFETQQANHAAYLARIRELANRLESNEAAVRELIKAYRDDSLVKQLAADRGVTPAAAGQPAPGRGFFSNVFSRLGIGRPPAPVDPRRSPFGPAVATLADAIASKLSEPTKQRLGAVGRTTDSLNVPDALSALDADSARAAEELYRGGASGSVARIGGTFVNIGDLVDFPNTFHPGHEPVRTPGICKPGGPEPPTVAEPGIPEGVGKFHSLGVADLLVVRQQLLRYELGEIAHVENVMAKETRKRLHRTLNRREELRLQEVERIEENERDLQSTERFELQNETERTIQENASRQAGVTVTASYGPSVEVTAEAAYSSETAKSESNRIASSHARELTERSVQRVQERIRELRTALTVSETEETNRHGFVNEGDDHVVGVYRWLDKVYQAQVFDYGKREILEFVVPEPAAFLRYAAANKPVEGVTLERPEPPGYCATQQSTFFPLEPKDITRTSYLLWTTRYKVQKVTPPPPRFRVTATAFDQPWITGDPKATAASNKELKVPDGYMARRAWSTGNHAHYASDVTETRNPELLIYVGRHLLNQGYAELNGENEVVPIAIIGVLLLVYAATVEVECELTQEAFEKWQVDTYTAILNAYDEQRAAYEQQVKAAEETTADVTVEGRNPLLNRAIERTELKKSVISQMTGQHFDLFDAMRRDVAPHGFPQADLNEAFAEGEYVRFVEQAFEWENMLYLFYPYFWGRKDKWPVTSHLDDPDPIHGEFLRAGAARINVPIRTGFESAVNTFLSTGRLPWKSENDPTITFQEPFLSIAEEMKSQQGAIHTKSGGLISVDNGSRDVTGVGTDFTDDDENREITIRGDVYRIKSVTSSTALTLTRDYRGSDAEDVGYVIGAKAVGEPWTLRLPTSLVMLQGDSTLPVFATEG